MDLFKELLEEGYALRNINVQKALTLKRNNPRTIKQIYRTKSGAILFVAEKMQGILLDNLIKEHKATEITEEREPKENSNPDKIFVRVTRQGVSYSGYVTREVQDSDPLHSDK